MRGTLITLLVAASVLVSAAAQPSLEARAESKRLRTIGLAAGYNLDYPEALDAFRAAMEADPDDPAPHRLFAATLWIKALFAQGAMTAEDYLGQARISVPRTPPAPEVDRAFREHVQRAATLAERAVKRDSREIGRAHV